MTRRSPLRLIIFNRPDLTMRTFSTIRQQRPERLFIVADGPRPQHPTDSDLCIKSRAIVENIDWPCIVYRNYSTSNLGPKLRISSGLTWVFDHVEEAIILEDDCVAHEDFFRFCELLLEKYKHDTRIWTITGNNFQNYNVRGDGSYYFSKYCTSWGWATWRRAWKNYQGSIPFWRDWSTSEDWHMKTPDKIEREYWSNIFNLVENNPPWDAWDYPWQACVWHQGGLCATPNINLVSNVGFGLDATHTKSFSSNLANTKTGEIGEIIHPTNIEQDIVADRYLFDYSYGGREQRLPRSLLHKANKIKGMIFRNLYYPIKKSISR